MLLQQNPPACTARNLITQGQQLQQSNSSCLWSPVSKQVHGLRHAHQGHCQEPNTVAAELAKCPCTCMLSQMTSVLQTKQAGMRVDADLCCPHKA